MTSSTPPIKQVALLVETSNAYARGLLRGVVAYIREHRPWSLHLAEHGRGDQPPGWLAGWRGDGIIARIETPAMARALRPLAMPVVDVSAARLIPALPWLETDDAAFALAAFEHLRERGFKRFAYCGDRSTPNRNCSRSRAERHSTPGVPCLSDRSFTASSWSRFWYQSVVSTQAEGTAPEGALVRR